MQLFKTLFDLATLPVAIVKDVFTLGMQKIETGESYTEEKINELDEDVAN